METITCRRCGRADAPKLDRPPFKNALGDRLFAEICQDCWKDWLKHQTSLINHYGLDPREQEARDFLYAQIDSVLFGAAPAEQAPIDTTKKGEISW